MRNYYVIKDDKINKLYTKYEFDKVQKYIAQNPLAYLKGFDNKEEAERWQKNKKAHYYYVVKQGNKTGIFTTKDEFDNAIKNFENPIYQIVKNKDAANRWNKMSLEEWLERQEIRKLEKEEHRKHKKEKNKKKEERRKNAKANFKIKDRYIAFIDCEANQDRAISIGIVIYDTIDKKIVDSYYSLVRYNDFDGLDYYVKKITHLKEEDVFNAPLMNIVASEIDELVDKYHLRAIYSWGVSDKRFVGKYTNEANINKFVNKIFNIQTTICSEVYEKFHNDEISLSNMKLIYRISDKKVTHNALDDALDLANVFHAWFTNIEPNTEITF